MDFWKDMRIFINLIHDTNGGQRLKKKKRTSR